MLILAAILFVFTITSLAFALGLSSTDQPQSSSTTQFSKVPSPLTDIEKADAIEEFFSNYGWLSPEAQQKILKSKYTSPAQLERDLNFYSQDEYIGKFENKKGNN